MESGVSFLLCIYVSIPKNYLVLAIFSSFNLNNILFSFILRKEEVITLIIMAKCSYHQP